MLLLLDNFEHILEAGPWLVEMLQAAPGLHCLVTSRSVLRLYGEHEYQVQPLQVPDPDDLPPLAHLAQLGAVALFVARSRAVNGAFARTFRSGVQPVEIAAGLKRELDIVGVGYRAEVKGRDVHFALGYSHPVVFPLPTGIDVAIEKQTHVTVTGIDKQLVGQGAANMRSLRKPDPYKQKGVRFTGEVLKKKAGKAGAK